jgi:D-alanine-D-alanine ligase-like ATP-grasp enzyme
MKEIVFITFDSIKKKIDIFNRKFCFEIFGFDFILDANLHLWLIEVNTNPCLEESSNLLKKLMPRMIGLFIL